MHTPSLDQKLKLSVSSITKPIYEVKKQKNNLLHNLFYFLRIGYVYKLAILKTEYLRGKINNTP